MVKVTCETCGKTFTLTQLIEAGFTLQDIINSEQECATRPLNHQRGI